MSMLRATFQRALTARPLLPSATPACHIARRFNSSGTKDEGRFTAPTTQKTHTDQLMNIISEAIHSSASNTNSTPMYRSGGRFRKGDIYKPSDLDTSKPRVYRAAPGKKKDELNIIGVNPLHEYKNAELLSHYITPVGRLMSREQTGLTAKNQRRLSKAVRRARAMCILSPTAKL
ncbi:hypothetical protein DFQ27_009660 [Actinomortierella ambigua]|uniref:Small ribosomal subunit protein bS18m n=1 Tax=Actinomortierella ambigua TaxID=1343610 RepID=A0A9P6QGA3_9FUNG|nr:hypothetical protein DFQ26_002829 [Actinomortierella ambigua]KAG0266550.1 hypothetical protein DFQ27_009660 [Actinomortierella ambigua]